MSSSITIITGNLGRDVEMRYTPKGTAVCDFSVATKNWKKETTWWKITAWGKLAETCNEYLKKGRLVQVVGEMVADERGNPKVYQKRDGTWGASFELTASKVDFLGGRPETQQVVDEVYGEDDVPPF
jgi:single-strand DNA-binding protein